MVFVETKKWVVLWGSGSVGSEDSVDPGLKNAKKVVAVVQAGSWSEVGRAGRRLPRRPAQIEWKEEITMASSSQLDPLGAQSLTDARNESHVIESCNEQLG